MNDLFSGSFSQFQSDDTSSPATVQMASTNGVNLDRFFQDVEAIKEDLAELESIQKSLCSSHEQSKTLHDSRAVRSLRSKMDADVSSALKKAKVIKVRLAALDRSNEANRAQPGCGPGSSSDRTRMSVVSGLGKKLEESMVGFGELRGRIGKEYKETVERRYYTVTGENADEEIIDRLIETGESENFLQKAIQQQGKGKIMDTIIEIQERHEGVKEMERNLKELHQVFLDMAVLVQHQGQQLDDIESQLNRASSYVGTGVQQLTVARKHQKNTRKWTFIAIVILLLIILFIVLFTVKPWN